jgi:hypothetical protein
MKESFKCQFCGREFNRLVNKNMHEKYCKKSEVTNKYNNKSNDKKISCEHDFVLLNDRIATHRQAIAQGYNAYCSKCKELT